MNRGEEASMSETLLGTAGEAAVLAVLTSMGIPCYMSFGDGHTADLIAEIGGAPRRLQVKSCGDSSATVRFRLAKRRRKGWAAYTDIDYFALYSSYYNRILLVPHTPGKKQINVRFRETSWSKKTDIRAEDVDVCKVLEDLENGI